MTHRPNTIPFHLTDREVKALDDLCAKKGLNRQQLMLCALRRYQLEVAAERGELPEPLRKKLRKLDSPEKPQKLRKYMPNWD